MINDETSRILKQHMGDLKIYVPLSMDAAIALRQLADQEHRDPKQQASFIIETELERRGLLKQPPGNSSSSEVTNDRTANS
jgi:hypothetical protein